MVHVPGIEDDPPWQCLCSLVSPHLPLTMPSEQHNRILLHQPLHEQQQKFCSSCHSALVDSTGTAALLPQLDALVCTGCREHGFSVRATLVPPDERRFHVDVSSSFDDTHTPLEQSPVSHDARKISDSLPFDHPIVVDSVKEMGHPCQNSFVSAPDYPSEPPSITICCDTNDCSDEPFQSTHISPTSTSIVPHRKSSFISSPDPLTDITYLRIRSQGHHCLYPGATFQGTQKSGRNSYDVNVTIVVYPSALHS